LARTFGGSGPVGAVEFVASLQRLNNAGFKFSYHQAINLESYFVWELKKPASLRRNGLSPFKGLCEIRKARCTPRKGTYVDPSLRDHCFFAFNPRSLPLLLPSWHM
jgi:hypothetical protein